MRKFLILILICFFVFALGGKNTYAYAKNGQDCARCHALNAEQAKAVLSQLIPDVKILSIQDGAVSGLWEIGFESQGVKSIVYLDYPFKHVIAGKIFSVQTRVNLTEESLAKINRVDLSGFPYKNALLLGDKNAKHRVVVFDDPD
ncbi:MAG: disulfide isomerase DsbC N-terminal domain-containing protein [Nitrospirota bacterium]